MIEELRWHGRNAVRFSGNGLQVTVLPELGGKLASIQNDDGHEFLFVRDGDYALPTYGGSFADWDSAGWDECFPTVAACTLADGPWAGVTAPCHGELWTLPHRLVDYPGELHLLVHGVRFPYTFTRIVRLPAPQTMTVTYLVRNESELPLPYLYSAHPLLAASAGCRVLPPAGIDTMRVDNSARLRLGGVGDEVGWPIAADRDGREVRLDRLTGPEPRTGDKLYTPRLTGSGQAGLIDEVRGTWVGFTWDTARLPRLGVWLNQGGFRGDFNLALEPCSGYPDRLDTAIARGEAVVLPPGGEAEWTIRFGAGAGGEDVLHAWWTA